MFWGKAQQNEDSFSGNLINAIYADTDCIIQVDKENGIFKVEKGTDKWIEYLGQVGPVKQLLFKLFTELEDNATAENTKYGKFVDESFFEADSFYGFIKIPFNGKKESYSLNLITTGKNQAGLIIKSNKELEQVNDIELDKIDAIQENYLFSMIVNLADDSCINPKATEISADRQDFMELKYSQWRMMISNMFKEADRSYFLRMSAPEHVINTLETKHRFEFEIQMENMQGKFIWSRLTFSRMSNFSRENPRFVYTVKDVNEEMTRLLNQESIIQAVEEQNNKLKESVKQRTRLFSGMSHEIRTPINAILGLDEVILRESTEDSIKKYANNIKSSGKYLLSIVNDILDFSVIEAGKMEIIPVEYNPGVVFKEVNTIVTTCMGEKDIEYIVDISDDVPKRLYGDETRFRQILINILTNAFKYTHEGYVKFSVSSRVSEEGLILLDVSVEDTGIGIREEDLSKLFKVYERLETQRNKYIEGSGLGLSIVESLLNQMESHLEVASTYGKGSKFSFTLAQKAVEINDDEEKSILDITGKRILAIDDMPLNLRVVAALLKPYGARVDLANSGKQGIKMLEENDYDLIFVDHMMPEMDGIETLKEIRMLGEKYALTPVIALTANVVGDTQKFYMNYGFTGYLEKPVREETLEDVIRTYLVHA